MAEIDYKKLLKASPHIFLRDVMGLRADGVHDEFISHLLDGGNRVLMLAPRGSGKSKIVQGLIAHHILNNPNDRIILVSQSHTKATIFMSGIKRALETSESVKNVWGDVVGDIWRDNSITLSTRTVNHVEPNLLALGAGSSAITGLHAEICVLDDVTDFDISRSEVQSERLETWFKTALIPVLQPGARVLAVGTRYAVRDLWGTLIDMEYNTKIFPAIRDGKSLIPWLRPMEDEIRPDGLVIGLNTMRRDMGSLLFALQMMNDVSLLAENNIIKQAWCQTYNELPKECDRPIISVDLAIGLKDENDFTCAGVWYRDSDRNIYLAEYVNDHLTFNQTITTLQRLIAKYTPERVIIEDVAYQKATIQEMKRVCTSTVITGSKPTTDKRARLIHVSNLFENGMIHFKPSQSLVTDQLVYFPARFDDAVDMTTLALTHYKENSGEPGVIIF